jgi:hypothetical protein
MINPSLFEDSSTHLQTNLSIAPFCGYVKYNAQFFFSFTFPLPNAFSRGNTR